jgi:hypothetical protein
MLHQDNYPTTVEKDVGARKERATQIEPITVVAQIELGPKRDTSMQNTHPLATVAIIPMIVPPTTLPPRFLAKDNILKSIIGIATTEIFQMSGTRIVIPLTTISPYVQLQPKYSSNERENYIISEKSPKDIHIKVYTEGVHAENR